MDASILDELTPEELLVLAAVARLERRLGRAPTIEELREEVRRLIEELKRIALRHN